MIETTSTPVTTSSFRYGSLTPKRNVSAPMATMKSAPAAMPTPAAARLPSMSSDCRKSAVSKPSR